MKASTLFGITFALLIGLGVVVGAKQMGYFDATPPETKKNGKAFQILVAERNLFKGTAASSNDAKPRPVTEAEMEFYVKNKDKLLAGLPGAVENRVLAKNVTAGQPLFEDHFEPQAFPETVTARLDPGMRSVSLVLPRERAAGGLVRVGERVDILLTSIIEPDGAGVSRAPFNATATIARNLKVIIKRDNLWTVMQPVPQDKPVSFILQANPYRAALLEFAKSKGNITLVPASAPLMRNADREPPVNDPDNREYRDEEKRVAEFVSNEQIISDKDLERIFNLKRVLSTPEPPLATTKVELMVGTRIEGVATVENGSVTARVRRGPGSAELTPAQLGAGARTPSTSGFLFFNPDNPVGCKTCGQKKN